MLMNLDNYLLLIVKIMIPFLLGSLIFFSTVVAPNTFQNLDKKNSRKFIRSIFPKLYLWSIFISLVIFLCLIKLNVFYSFLFFIILLGYVYSKTFLIKRINKVGDKNLMKETEKKEFENLHRLSVFIFLLQIILMLSIYFLI